MVKLVADLGFIHMTGLLDGQSGSFIETSTKISEDTIGDQAVYGKVRVAGTCPLEGGVQSPNCS